MTRRPTPAPTTIAAMALAGALLVVGPGCSDDVASPASTSPASTSPASTSPASTSPASTSPVDLAALLLQPDDLGDGWALATDLTPQDLEIGAERCEDQAIDPTIIERIQPITGTIITSDDGRLGLREMLSTGERTRLASDFRLLVEGTLPCLGRTETTPDGEHVTYEASSLPDLGDDSFAMRMVVAEPPSFDRIWTIRMAAVLVDDVIVIVDQSEILDQASTPTFSDEQFVTVMERAVELVRDGV